MAESNSSSKGGLFAKVIQKQVKRSKEKVLHKFGKTDKTNDEIIEEHENNFNKQQAAAAKLQKELKHYMQCIKAMSTASKNFYDAIGEVYENEWIGANDVQKAVEYLESLWTDYMTKLQDSVSRPLTLYLEQFPEVKNKIAKRRRKLLDFDSARHNFEAQQNAKKKDDAKVAKAHDEFRDAKKIYEVINNELHEELPDMYDRRIDFYTTNLHSFFTAENVFMEESAKITCQLVDIVDSLQVEKLKGTYDTKRTPTLSRGQVLEDVEIENKAIMEDSTAGLNLSQFSHSPGHGEDRDRPSSQLSANHSVENEEVEAVVEEAKRNGLPEEENHVEKRISAEVAEAVVDTVAKETTEPQVEEATYEPVSVGAQLRKKGSKLPTTPPQRQVPKPVPRKSIQPESKGVSDSQLLGRIEESAQANSDVENADKITEVTEAEQAIYSVPKDIDDTYVVPGSNRPISEAAPEVVLYKVEATHPYTGEDTDELTFEKGDIICVVPFEDPEDQDEGWLMGHKLSGGEKGVFPANFTKRI